MTAINGVPVVLITTPNPLLGKVVAVTVSNVAKGGMIATKATNGLGMAVQEVASGGLPIVYTT